MVYKIAEELDREPAWKEIERAIRRSFGGLDDIDPVKFFGKQFPQARRLMVMKQPALDGITRRVRRLVTQFELRPTAKTVMGDFFSLFRTPSLNILTHVA